VIKRTGDVFTTEAAFLGHGVNLRGVMGAGVAKTVREKYPNTYTAYKEMTDKGELGLGFYLACREDGITIFNLATQLYPGPDARYDAVFGSCFRAAQDISYKCKSGTDGRRPVMAIPHIASDIGGLEWSKVEKLLEAIEILVPGFQFEVWEYKR
jgi:hypothetical protein